MVSWTMARSLAKNLKAREQSPEVAEWLADMVGQRGNTPRAIRLLSLDAPEVAQVLVDRQREEASR